MSNKKEVKITCPHCDAVSPFTVWLSVNTKDDPELKPIKRDDEWAKNVIREFLHIESGTILQSYDLQSRNEALRMLKSRL